MPTELSNCCGFPVEVEGGEGTNHYVCTLCGMPCDLKAGEKPDVVEAEPEAFDPNDNRYKWPEDRK